MSLGPELLNDPNAWGPWYYFPLAIFLFLSVLFVVGFVERHIVDGIIQKFRNATTWADFTNMQSLKRHISESVVVEGYKWLANNTEGDATVLAWWDYANGIQTLGHRKAVIKGASRDIKDTIEGMHRHPWTWIKYNLWYPFESEEKVKDVANFFVTENETEAIEVVRNYNANYVLVLYPGDIYKCSVIALASGKNPDDYIIGKLSLEEIEDKTVVKKETIGIKMIYGDEVEGFEKVFDNERVRIYRLK